MCVLLEYLNGVLYINEWASIIQTFRLSEHTQGPASSDNRGTTVLKFSIPKCHVLKVTRATKHKIISDYYLHYTPLQIVENCMYLGVTIQSDLNWFKPIHNITVKASHTLSFLRINLKLHNQQLKETAYFSLVQPQLEYASIIWSPWQRRDIEKLEKINRRAARFITNNFYRTSSVSSMIHQLGWQETRRHI